MATRQAPRLSYVVAPPANRSEIRSSRSVAATLSFIWPGLGHLYLRRGRSAMLYAAPALLIVAVLALELARGITVFAARMFDPSFSLTLLILILLVGAWRLLAIVDVAVPRPSSGPLHRRARAVVGLLLVLVVAMHGAAVYYVFAFYEAGSTIFVGEDPRGDQPPAGNSNGPNPSDDYDVPPFSTPSTATGRVTVLLTGIDKNEERTHSLTDTLLVATVDPASGSVSMVSFPRDIAGFPLVGGGTYAGKINSLMSWVAKHPDQFPDGPLPTLAKQLSFLLGVQINYFAAVDLDGFQRLIGVVGGVTIDVDRPISDPTYAWLDGSPPGFYLAAGRQTLDARTAMAYVRSRMGAGNNDFTRADRQQQLLLALRAQLLDPSNIGRLPAVLDAAAGAVRTNFPPDRVDDMLSMFQSLGVGSIRRVVLQPPTYTVHPPTNTTGGTYVLRLQMDAIRALSVELFGKDSAYWSGTFDAAGVPIPLAAP